MTFCWGSRSVDPWLWLMDQDPDPYLWLTDLETGGPKTNGSDGSGPNSDPDPQHCFWDRPFKKFAVDQKTVSPDPPVSWPPRPRPASSPWGVFLVKVGLDLCLRHLRNWYIHCKRRMLWFQNKLYRPDYLWTHITAQSKIEKTYELKVKNQI